MPQGTPEHVPDDGLTTRQRRNRALEPRDPPLQVQPQVERHLFVA